MQSRISPEPAELLNGSDGGSGADGAGSIADQIARRSVASREAEYAVEVRRLLDAGSAVMVRYGTKSSPRVADIVAESGLSNDAFYRHFRGKDELVTAILEDGTARLHRRLVRQMNAVEDPAGKVRAWVVGVLNQASVPEVADAIRATLWNGARVSDDSERRISARQSLARPLVEPLTSLGAPDPPRDALAVCHSALGLLEHFLWRRLAPAEADVEHQVAFALRSLGLRPG
ncbi:MAG: regulatory protein TetR [Acidimicrobiia bacterium]|nr:regulatory protein TetR [Acidimicrobiia bacterium]